MNRKKLINDRGWTTSVVGWNHNQGIILPLLVIVIHFLIILVSGWLVNCSSRSRDIVWLQILICAWSHRSCGW